MFCVDTFRPKTDAAKRRPKKKRGKISRKILVTLAFALLAHSRHAKNAPCHRHGHLPWELAGLPRPPRRRQAAPLLRAVAAPAQRPAAAGAATADADADAAAAHASPAAGEAERAPAAAASGADSTDWVATSLTRRFGIGAGLAWVGFLAFGVVSEQLKTRFEVAQQLANTKSVKSPSSIDSSASSIEFRF